MSIDLPNTKQELISLLSQIHKFEKNDKRAGLTELTNLWIHNRTLVIDFYSTAPYTTYQPEYAAYLYVQHGVDVYQTIKKIIPDELGKVVTSWDDFMQRQIKYIVDIAWHQDGWEDKHEKTIIKFSQDIEDVCEDDLYVTIMTKLVRTPGVEGISIQNDSNNSLNPNDYVIDEDFFKRKAQDLPKNQNGMKEYVALVNSLAAYDAIAAMRAWGNFYYVFEEVYETKPPKKYSFTVALYNTLYTAARDSNEINEKIKKFDPPEAWKQRDYLSKQKVDGYIFQYGWQYLHHAFEINTLNESDIIYNALPEVDKIKADKARDIVKERIQKKQLTEKPPQGVANEIDLQILEETLSNNPSSGIEPWKLCLKTLENSAKVTKPIRKKHLDDILYNVMNKQLFSGPSVYVKIPSMEYFELPYPELFQEILKDKWLTEYIFSNCQLIMAPIYLAAYTLVLQDEKQYKELIRIISSNKNIKDIRAFKEKILLNATQRFEFMLTDVKHINEMIQDNPNVTPESIHQEIGQHSPITVDDIKMVIDHPNFASQITKLIKKCKVISGV